MANDANMRQTSEASKFAQRSSKGKASARDGATAALESSDEDILSRMEVSAGKSLMRNAVDGPRNDSSVCSINLTKRSI